MMAAIEIGQNLMGVIQGFFAMVTVIAVLWILLR
jgi:hypothetical protein